MGHLEPEILQEEWLTYKDCHSITSRNQLVLHYTSLVRYVAAKVGGQLVAWVDRDDLISYGMFGLIDAIEKFDLDRGVKFETYAVRRIHGAILDEIRSLDWVPRSVRSKAKEIVKAQEEVEMLLGRPAQQREVAEYLGIPLEDYWRLASESNASTIESYNREVLVEGNQESSYDVSFDPGSNPEDLAQVKEVVELVGEAINQMDQMSKTILTLYYLHEMKLAEIGQIFGVTESRVCQLQGRALQSLRAAFNRSGLVAA